MTKRWIPALLVGLVAVGIILWRGWQESTTATEPQSDSQTSLPGRSTDSSIGRTPDAEASVDRSRSGKVTLHPASELLEDLHATDTSAEDDLQILDALLIAYRRANQSNPSGENYEIVEALTGGNPSTVAVVPKNHPSLSADGEILDRWGAPYHFHSISSQKMEIRSAGPDGKLWSEDDVQLEAE